MQECWKTSYSVDPPEPSLGEKPTPSQAGNDFLPGFELQSFSPQVAHWSWFRGPADQTHRPPPLNHTSITSFFHLLLCGWAACAGGPWRPALASWRAAPRDLPPLTVCNLAVWGGLQTPFLQGWSCHLPHPALVLGTSHASHRQAFSPLLHCAPLLLPNPLSRSCLLLEVPLTSPPRVVWCLGACGLVQVTLQRFPRHLV